MRSIQTFVAFLTWILVSCEQRRIDATEGYINVYVQAVEKSYQEKLKSVGSSELDHQINSLYELRLPFDTDISQDIDRDPWGRNFILCPIQNEDSIFFIILSKGPDGIISEDDILRKTKEFKQLRKP